MRRTFLVAWFILLAASACNQDPTASDEYRSLAAERNDLVTSLKRLEARLSELDYSETPVRGATTTTDAEHSSETIVELERTIAEMRSEVAAQRDLAETLGLRYEPWNHSYVSDSCGTGELPDDWQTRSVFVGPLALWTMGTHPSSDGHDVSTKTLAVLEPDTTATLVIPEEWRSRVGLLYDPSAWVPSGRYLVDDGVSAVTFRSCESSPTDFQGGFVFKAGAACVPVDLYIDESLSADRYSVPLGQGTCDTTP